MTTPPDQATQTVATSPAGPIPVQAPFPTHKAGHTVNTGEQDTLDQRTGDEDVGNINQDSESDDLLAEPPARPREEQCFLRIKRCRLQVPFIDVPAVQQRLDGAGGQPARLTACQHRLPRGAPFPPTQFAKLP